MVDQRIEFNQSIVAADPSQAQFLDGWNSRANSFGPNENAESNGGATETQDTNQPDNADRPSTDSSNNEDNSADSGGQSQPTDSDQGSGGTDDSSGGATSDSGDSGGESGGGGGGGGDSGGGD